MVIFCFYPLHKTFKYKHYYLFLKKNLQETDFIFFFQNIFDFCKNIFVFLAIIPKEPKELVFWKDIILIIENVGSSKM